MDAVETSKSKIDRSNVKETINESQMSSKKYADRYMSEATQKKTSFRQLLNADRSKANDSPQRNCENSKIVTNSHSLRGFEEHSITETDFVKIPQRSTMYNDRIRGIKSKYNPPDILLVPDSKYKESYLHLLTQHDKPFNRKVNH